MWAGATCESCRHPKCWEKVSTPAPLPQTIKTTHETGYVKLGKWEDFSSSLHEGKKADQTLAFIIVAQYMNAMLEQQVTNGEMVVAIYIDEGLGK